MGKGRRLSMRGRCVNGGRGGGEGRQGGARQLEAGVEVDATDDDGYTALFMRLRTATFRSSSCCMAGAPT